MERRDFVKALATAAVAAQVVPDMAEALTAQIEAYVRPLMVQKTRLNCGVACVGILSQSGLRSFQLWKHGSTARGM